MRKPQRKAVSAYFGRETVVRVIPGGLVPEEPKTKEVRLSLGNQDDPSINQRYGLVHIMEGISHKTTVLIQ